MDLYKEQFGKQMDSEFKAFFKVYGSFFLGCFDETVFSYSSLESMKEHCLWGEYRALTATGSFSWLPLAVVTS